MKGKKRRAAELARDEAEEEYRRAVAAADRMRRRYGGLGEKPTDEEVRAAEERIRKAFLRMSRQA